MEADSVSTKRADSTRGERLTHGAICGESTMGVVRWLRAVRALCRRVVHTHDALRPAKRTTCGVARERGTRLAAAHPSAIADVCSDVHLIARCAVLYAHVDACTRLRHAIRQCAKHRVHNPNGSVHPQLAHIRTF